MAHKKKYFVSSHSKKMHEVMQKKKKYENIKFCLSVNFYIIFVHLKLRKETNIFLTFLYNFCTSYETNKKGKYLPYILTCRGRGTWRGAGRDPDFF